MSTQDAQEQDRPGWYVDPWGSYAWRWWDGLAWTANVSVSTKGQPHLPNWLSIPLIICGPFTIFLACVYAYINPLAVGLSLVPIPFMVAGIWWLNRIEPQPWASLVHAFMWGALVSTLMSIIVNTIGSIILGIELTVIAVAPLIEEATKGLAVVWALRRKEVDGVMDGAIVAIWSGVGFAAFENFGYLASTESGTETVLLFLVRGVLGAFAHPLFTLWIGVAVGLSVRWKQSTIVHLLWGYGLAVSCHAAWNGTATYISQRSNATTIGDFLSESLTQQAYAVYLTLSFCVILTLIFIRISQRRIFATYIPFLAERYQISEKEIEVFGDWRLLLATRRTLNRRQKGNFDRLHASLAKLALAHSGPAKVDRTSEELLATQLQQARSRAFKTRL